MTGLSTLWHCLYMIYTRFSSVRPPSTVPCSTVFGIDLHTYILCIFSTYAHLSTFNRTLSTRRILQSPTRALCGLSTWHLSTNGRPALLHRLPWWHADRHRGCHQQSSVQRWFFTNFHSEFPCLCLFCCWFLRKTWKTCHLITLFFLTLFLKWQNRNSFCHPKDTWHEIFIYSLCILHG